MEKRDANRVEFKTEAEVSSGDITVTGEVGNLSLKGMFLNTENKIPKDTEVSVKIHLSGSTTELHISLKGTVARHDEKGMAIIFQEMELDSFIHLKNIVYYADPDHRNINEFL